jgi:hypothetical protein
MALLELRRAGVAVIGRARAHTMTLDRIARLLDVNQDRDDS